MKHRFSAFILFLCCVTPVAAQEKSEREYRAALQDIPEAARQYVDAFRFTDKVKWYVEEGLTQKSLEAKTGKGENRFSIEFGMDGHFQDLEIQRDWNTLDTDVKTRMEARLHADFSGHKVDKVQVQYSGDAEAVREFVLNALQPERVTVKYELEVEGTADGGRALFEYTFSSAGDFEKRKKVILRPSDNLEF